MIRRSALRFGAPLLIAAAVAGACSSSSSQTSSTSAGSGGSTTSVAQLAAATLNGSGSTFQANFEDAAIQAFEKMHSGVTINYNPVGSGQGQTDLEGQVTDFAGSDVAVSASDVAKFKGSILYFPIVAAPITVSYNLSGVSKLQLSGDTLAKIFARKIKTWNDPAIAADNPGVTLPGTAITVAHRSDGSGTTGQFTLFLQKVGGSDWTLGAGKTVNWPADTQAGKGNPGVVNVVKSTKGAIGYIDYSDAKAAGLSFADVKNANGKFVTPTLDATSAAVSGATVQSDLLIDPINAPGDTVYPIASPTYIIAYAKMTDPAKAAALKAFLSYILGADGQALADSVDFARLPADLAAKALAQVDQITTG